MSSQSHSALWRSAYEFLVHCANSAPPFPALPSSAYGLLRNVFKWDLECPSLTHHPPKSNPPLTLPQLLLSPPLITSPTLQRIERGGERVLGRRAHGRERRRGPPPALLLRNGERGKPDGLLRYARLLAETHRSRRRVGKLGGAQAEDASRGPVPVKCERAGDPSDVFRRDGAASCPWLSEDLVNALTFLGISTLILCLTGLGIC